MAAVTDAAARIGRGTADEAAQRLLPSGGGGGVEMTSVTIDPFGGGGAARRRARVLERLGSLDPENHGSIDKQQLVDLVDDVLVAETSRRTMRSGTLLMAAFAAVLLVGIFGMTWTVVRGLHARIDRLSEHVTAQSVQGGDLAQRDSLVGRPSIVLERVSRFVRQRTAASEQVDGMQRHRFRFNTDEAAGGGGGNVAQLYSVEYEDLYTGASVPRSQLSAICASVDKGELDFVVHFKGGVMMGGWPASNTTGPVERPHKVAKPIEMGRRKATIGDAGICDDPSGLTGVLSFQVPYEAHPWGGPRMLAKITCTSGDEATACPFAGSSPIQSGLGFDCAQKGEESQVWTCPELTWEPFMPDKPTEAQVTKMCGATAGTCYRNLTRPVDDRHASRWGVGGQSSGISQMIEPTDSCVLFNATSLQCLRCRASCATACRFADAPPVETCKAKPETAGCDTCTADAACGQQLCGERCIPAHMKVTVRNRAADPEGFDRLRPCCKSTNGVPWTLQSDAGAPRDEKRCYPA